MPLRRGRAMALGIDRSRAGVGAQLGLFPTPDDYQQGLTVKILFLHVPAALIAINAWLMMLVREASSGSSAATPSRRSP